MHDRGAHPTLHPRRLRLDVFLPWPGPTSLSQSASSLSIWLIHVSNQNRLSLVPVQHTSERVLASLLLISLRPNLNHSLLLSPLAMPATLLKTPIVLLFVQIAAQSIIGERRR